MGLEWGPVSAFYVSAPDAPAQEGRAQHRATEPAGPAPLLLERFLRELTERLTVVSRTWLPAWGTLTCTW